MSRTLGTDLALIHRLRTAEAVYFVELELSGGTVYLTTASQDILWNGHTYLALGGNMEIEPVAETTDDRSQGVGIKASGVDQTLLALLLSNQSKGRYATVYLAHIHTTTNLQDNPEALTNINGYSVNGGGVNTRDTTFSENGVASLKTAIANASSCGPYLRLRSGARYPVVPGTNYTFSLDIYADATATGKLFRIIPHWWTGSSYITSPVIEIAGLLPGWNRYSGTVQCPAGVVDGLMALYTKTAQGTFNIWTSNWKVEPGSVATPYQSGYDAAIQEGTVALDPLIVFKGFMNEAFNIEEERDDQGNDIGSVTISTRLASRMAVMAKVRGIRTNLESHQALFPGDTFFKFVPTLQGKKIKWGG